MSLRPRSPGPMSAMRDRSRRPTSTGLPPLPQRGSGLATPSKPNQRRPELEQPNRPGRSQRTAPPTSAQGSGPRAADGGDQKRGRLLPSSPTQREGSRPRQRWLLPQSVILQCAPTGHRDPVASETIRPVPRQCRRPPGLPLHLVRPHLDQSRSSMADAEGSRLATGTTSRA